MSNILFGLIAEETLEAKGPFGKGKKHRKAVRRKPKGTPESRKRARILKVKEALKRLPELIKNEKDPIKKKVRVRRLAELKVLYKNLTSPKK
jgi:hypothetical protein